MHGHSSILTLNMRLQTELAFTAKTK